MDLVGNSCYFHGNNDLMGFDPKSIQIYGKKQLFIVPDKYCDHIYRGMDSHRRNDQVF